MLTAVFLLAGLYSWPMKDWTPQTMARLPEFGGWLPVWFACLHEVLLGDAVPYYARKAERGSIATAAVVVLSVVT